MTGVINLGAARAKRDAELEKAKAACETLVEYLTLIAENQATIAFSVSGPIWHHHRQFAIDINRSQWRRLRSTIRKTCKRVCVGDAMAQALDFADAVFVSRLAVLGDERDELRRAQR